MITFSDEPAANKQHGYPHTNFMRIWNYGYNHVQMHKLLLSGLYGLVEGFIQLNFYNHAIRYERPIYEF
jgi:cytoplasmic iron level regulating protein YaaA (DUF328/UPF0246 family)